MSSAKIAQQQQLLPDLKDDENFLVLNLGLNIMVIGDIDNEFFSKPNKHNENADDAKVRSQKLTCKLT